MRLRTLAVLAVVVPVVARSERALAWGDEGHQLVARIAARNLNDKAVQALAAILRKDAIDDLNLIPLVGASGHVTAKQLEEAFYRMATWPDHMPGGKGKTAPWHYIDIGLHEGSTPAGLAEALTKRCADDDCVTHRLRNMLANASKGKNEGAFEPYRELRFIIHFAGDIHQPLHCSTNADAGGNCVKTVGYEHTNELHAVWDTELVKRVDDETDGDIGKALEDAFSARKAEFQSLRDPDKIAEESFHAAVTSVYGVAQPKIPTVGSYIDVSPKECSSQAPVRIQHLRINGPESFGDASLAVVRVQLYKAGVRLAAMLNELFG